MKTGWCRQELEAGRGHRDSALGMIVRASGHSCTAGRAGRAQCWAVAGGPVLSDSWKPPGCVSKAPRLCWHALPACGQVFSPNTLPPLQAGAASWPSISEQVLSESGAGWLQPCVHGLYFLSFPPWPWSSSCTYQSCIREPQN